MKPQSSSEREEFSELFSPELRSFNEQEGASEPTEPTFVDDDEPLPLTPFVTRAHLPEALYREFEADMESISSSTASKVGHDFNKRSLLPTTISGAGHSLKINC